MASVQQLQQQVGDLTETLRHSKDPHIVLLFLMEELGEVTRAYLKETGHKEENTRVTESFRQEMGDVFLLLLRLAHITGTDLEHQLSHTIEKLRKAGDTV